MERHLHSAAKLMLVLAAVNVVLGAAACYFLHTTRVVDFSRNSNEFFRSTPLYGILALATLIYGLVLAGPLLVAGLALIRLTPWAQGAATLVATFALLLFPLGTLVGGYALWVLMADETSLLFDYRAKSDRNILRSR
ncbi:MAG: hypothetical protein IT160_20335 [Bryobacterales bacterium]|nr:hypothetical protein [Bryobacterales bacterium]